MGCLMYVALKPYGLNQLEDDSARCVFQASYAPLSSPVLDAVRESPR